MTVILICISLVSGVVEHRFVYLLASYVPSSMSLPFSLCLGFSFVLKKKKKKTKVSGVNVLKSEYSRHWLIFHMIFHSQIISGGLTKECAVLEDLCLLMSNCFMVTSTTYIL